MHLLQRGKYNPVFVQPDYSSVVSVERAAADKICCLCYYLFVGGNVR